MTLWIELTCKTVEPDSVWSYLQSDEQGNLIQKGQLQLNQLPKSSEVVAVLPATRVSWQQVQLPNIVGKKVPRAKLLPIIHGILEEQLLDDIDALHFAVEPKDYYDNKDENTIWVAICNKTWLQQQINFLQTAGIVLHRIVPEMTPTNTQQQDCYWVKEQNGKTNLFTSCQQGVFIQPFNIAETLHPIHKLPDASTILVQPSLSSDLESVDNTTIKLLSAEYMATHLSQIEWNLAQFDLKLHRHDRYLKDFNKICSAFLYQPAWRHTRWGLVSLLTIVLVGLNVSAWQEKHKIKLLEQNIKQNYINSFPKTPLRLAPVKMMQREVTSLRQHFGITGEDDFETIFNLAASSLPKSNQITSLNYKTSELIINFNEKPTEQEAIISNLKSYGYLASFNDNKLIIRRQP